MDVVFIILLWIFLIAGVAVILFGVAGTFVIVGASLVYGLVTGFETISLPFVGLLLGLALAVELVEELLSGVMAKRYGGTKWAVAGAIVGGLVGAVLGTPVAPVLGTLLGGFLGAFGGATLLEWLHTSDLRRAARVGVGAFFGAVGGKITKILVAVIMVVLVGIRLFG